MGCKPSIPYRIDWLIKTPFAREIDLDTELHLRDCLYNLDQLHSEMQGCLRPKFAIEVIEHDVDSFEFRLTEYYRVTHVECSGSLQTDRDHNLTHVKGFVSVGIDKLVGNTILTILFIWITGGYVTTQFGPSQQCFWSIMTVVFIGFWIETIYRLHRIEKILNYTFTRNIDDHILPKK